MSRQSQHLNVVPTVTMLGVIKAHLVGTIRGHALLKKKSYALTVQFHQILKKITTSLKVRSRQKNIARVKLPKFEHFSEGETKNDLTGLEEGARVNALENVVKPGLENTVTYIKGELDELEREDFFHLKKIQGYKRREVQKQMASAKLYAEEKTTEEISLKRGIALGSAHNLLSHASQKNEDIIF
ncbi:hypothetical protein HAX54_006116 [Datura stramonium]|uniref:Uncharacterized protein n=1 Tax=Datura stramonium TaxID=4076 RepID=A0ABS8TBG2_DATST|nr:hypothetical protein [Datura stramonium]